MVMLIWVNEILSYAAKFVLPKVNRLGLYQDLGRLSKEMAISMAMAMNNVNERANSKIGIQSFEVALELPLKLTIAIEIDY